MAKSLEYALLNEVAASPNAGAGRSWSNRRLLFVAWTIS
jgi:hypothetical protein